jgi:hypothetical protein
MSNLLDELYQKDTQTRIATGGARGIDPTIVEKVRGAELADMGQKAAVQAGMAENMRQNRVEEGLQDRYIKDSKTAQNLNAVAMLGTTYLGSREGAKPAVSEQGQGLRYKPVFVWSSVFDVPIFQKNQETGKWGINAEWENNVFGGIK